MRDDYILRSDAIKAIEDLPNCYNGFSDTYDKAYIIGALEEVPAASQSVGDYISRQDMMVMIGRYVGTVDKSICRRIVAQMPSAPLNRLQQAVDGKTPEEIYDFLHWLMLDYVKQFTDSRVVVMEWLRGYGEDWNG